MAGAAAADMPCPSDELCLADSTGAMYCMASCEPAVDGTLCDDGATCLTDSGGVCWGGGTVGVGGACTYQRDCLRGGLCVRPRGTAAAVCYRACDLDRDTCPTGQTCMETVEGSGYCDAT